MCAPKPSKDAGAPTRPGSNTCDQRRPPHHTYTPIFIASVGRVATHHPRNDGTPMQGADKQARGCIKARSPDCGSIYLPASRLAASGKQPLSWPFRNPFQPYRQPAAPPTPASPGGTEKIELPRRRAPPPPRRVQEASARSPPARVPGPPLAPALADPCRAPAAAARPRAGSQLRRARHPTVASRRGAPGSQNTSLRSSRPRLRTLPLAAASPQAPGTAAPPARSPQPAAAPRHPHVTISDCAEARTSEEETRPGGRTARSQRPLLRRTAIQTAPSPAFLAPFILQNVPSSGNSAGSAHQWLPPAFGMRP